MDATTKVQTGVAPVDDTVYMVILKLDSVAGGNTTVYMNVYGPGDSVANEPSWQASYSASSDLVANYIRLYAQNATNQNNLAAFDEIRIADSWAVISGMPTECGDDGTILYTDINADCVIDLADFAFMGSQWLMTTDPADPEAVRLGYEDGTASTTQNNVIFENSITVDADLSEWDDAQWFSINSEVIAAPDIAEAQFAVAWNPAQSDTIYIAAKVRDTDHNFASSIGTWNAGDMLEVRIEGTGAGVDDTSWWDDQNIAQMYRIAYNGSGGSWASWGVNTLEPVSNPDAGLTYAVAIDPTDTDVIVYEAAVKVYNYFGGFDSGTTTLRNLSHNDVVRLGFQANTVYSGGSGALGTHLGAAYNNPSTWLPFTAVENSQLQCGDFGYLDADIVENCEVGLEDLKEIAFTWLICTDPADESCLPIWLP